MSIFDAGSSCGIFGMESWATFASLTFLRAETTATSFGHVSQFFSAVYTVRIDMQPGGGGFLRLMHGQLEPIAYTGTVRGYVALQNGDRVSYLSSLLEVANVNHLGVLQTEASFQLVR